MAEIRAYTHVYRGPEEAAAIAERVAREMERWDPYSWERAAIDMGVCVLSSISLAAALFFLVEAVPGISGFLLGCAVLTSALSLGLLLARLGTVPCSGVA